MKNGLKIVQLMLAFALLTQTKIAAQTADLILINGKIFTSNTKELYTEALAIKGNKILAVGSTVSIKKLASAKTKRIDLKGKTVVPGFNDAHDHPGFESPNGASYIYTEMNPAGLSKATVLDSVARLVKRAKPKQWITGFIGTVVLFDNTMRASLDSLAPNNPVALQIWWGHGMVVNKMALEASGLSDQDAEPTGGWYIRAAGSDKINSFQQNAQAAVWIALNNSDVENHVNTLRSYSQQQLKEGITTVQYMGTGLTASTASNLLKKANLSQRIRVIAWPRTTARGRQLNDWTIKNTHATPFTNIDGIKYVIDGTPMEENALRTIPYKGRPDWYGRLNYPIDTMKQIFKEALSSNRQLMMHITADSSFSVVLSLMKEMGRGDQWRSKRVRIEHNCVGDISPSQKKTLKDLGILMMHTPKYCMGSPLRSLMESGVTVGISPDGTTNPFIDLMMATTWASNPSENLTMEQAVIAYTKNNAYAEFAEETKGTLSKGMLADLTVLSQDIFAIPAQQLPATESLMTIVDGKIVYEKQNLR